MKDSSFESRAKTAQRALFPDWVVILLSIGALMVGLVGTFYLTFDLYGDPGIDECALASIFTFILGVGAFAAAIGRYRLTASMFSASTGAVLLILTTVNLLSYAAAPSPGGYSSSNDLVIMYFIATAFAAPLFAVGIFEARHRRWRWYYAYIASIVAVMVVFGSGFVLPAQELINSQRDAPPVETQVDTELSQEATNNKRLSQAAKDVVASLSKASADGNPPLEEITAPDGYSFVEYEVVDKHKVRFCITSLEEAEGSSVVGVIAQLSSTATTLYWPTSPTNDCAYRYDNRQELKPSS